MVVVMKQTPAPRHRNGMRSRVGLLLVMLAVTIGVGGAQTPVDVGALGPQVGSRVPAFAATDQAGRAHTLQTLLGPKGALLVFSRSADW